MSSLFPISLDVNSKKQRNRSLLSCSQLCSQDLKSCLVAKRCSLSSVHLLCQASFWVFYLSNILSTPCEVGTIIPNLISRENNTCDKQKRNTWARLDTQTQGPFYEVVLPEPTFLLWPCSFRESSPRSCLGGSGVYCPAAHRLTYPSFPVFLSVTHSCLSPGRTVFPHPTPSVNKPLEGRVAARTWNLLGFNSSPECSLL